VTVTTLNDIQRIKKAISKTAQVADAWVESRDWPYLKTFSRYLGEILDFSFQVMPLPGDKKLSKSEVVRWENISELAELTQNDISSRPVWEGGNDFYRCLLSARG